MIIALDLAGLALVCAMGWLCYWHGYRDGIRASSTTDDTSARLQAETAERRAMEKIRKALGFY
jgi:hypothetical protein